MERARGGTAVSETDDIALAGIVSTQLVHRKFFARFSLSSPLGAMDDVKVCFGEKAAGAAATRRR